MNFRIFQTDRFTMDFGIGPQQLLDLTIRCMGMNIQKVVMIFDHNSVDEKKLYDGVCLHRSEFPIHDITTRPLHAVDQKARYRYRHIPDVRGTDSKSSVHTLSRASAKWNGKHRILTIQPILFPVFDNDLHFVRHYRPIAHAKTMVNIPLHAIAAKHPRSMPPSPAGQPNDKFHPIGV